jgi:hypothetical protein
MPAPHKSANGPTKTSVDPRPTEYHAPSVPPRGDWSSSDKTPVALLLSCPRGLSREPDSSHVARITLTFSRIVDERLNPVNYTAAQYIAMAR